MREIYRVIIQEVIFVLPISSDYHTYNNHGGLCITNIYDRSKFYIRALMNSLDVCLPECVHALRERRMEEWVLQNVFPPPTLVDILRIRSVVLRWEHSVHTYNMEIFRLYSKSSADMSTVTKRKHL
jgi:hypothetical protein